MTTRPSPNGHRREPPHRATDWDALGYRPGPGTPLRTCDRCSAKYLDDEPSRQARIAVFGHSPKTPEPAKTPQEDNGDR